MNQESHSSSTKSGPSIASDILVHFRQFIASDFSKKILETLSTRLVLIVLGLFTGILVARALGPEGRGLFAMAMLVGTLGVQFGNLGMHGSNTRYVAQDQNLLAPLLGNSLLVGFAFGGFFSIAGWAVFYLFPEWAPIRGPLLVMALLWIPIGLTYLFMQNLLLGLQDVRSYNKIELGAKLFNLFLLGSIILFGLISPQTVFATALVTLPFSFLFAFKRIRKGLAKPPLPSWSIFKRTLPYGTKSYIGSMLGFLLLRIDLLMVNKIIGEKAAGLYDVAYNMSEMFYILPSVVTMILFPKLCAIANMKEKWLLAKKSGTAVFIILIILFSALSFMAELIIGLLFGEAFLGCAPIFILLMISKLMMAANSIYSFFIASVHVPISSIPFNLFLVFLNIFLNFVLIGKLGMAGAAISSIICFGLQIPFHMYYAVRYLKNPDKYTS